MEPEKKNSIEIEVPAMVRTKLSFEFNASSPYGKYEELVILIESGDFDLPAAERGNFAGYPASDRISDPINIPLNTSGINQKITISGMNKVFPGARSWQDSDVRLIVDKLFEKILGFNSIAQPTNYKTMICSIVFYL